MLTAEMLRLYLATPTYEELQADPNFVQKMWEVEDLFEDLVYRPDLIYHLSVSIDDLRVYRSEEYEGTFTQRTLLGKDHRRLQLQLLSEWVHLWYR